MPWAPPDPEASAPPTDGERPWGMVDPGPLTDGRWVSRDYASSSTRSSVLRLMLGLQIAFDIGVIAFERGLTFTVDSGLRLTAGQVSIVRAVAGAVGPASMVIAVILMAAIFAWISRVVENVPALTGRTPERSPRESIGWWLVPIASWAVPYLIVRDAAWRLRTTPDDAAVRLILPWWLLRLGANVAGFAIGRPVPLDDATTVLVSQVVLLVEALADALMIAVVASVARDERAQAARLDFSGRRGQEWPRFAAVDRRSVPARVPGGWSAAYRPGLAMRPKLFSRPDDPLAQASDEPDDAYQDRLLAALEAEATER